MFTSRINSIMWNSLCDSGGDNQLFCRTPPTRNGLFRLISKFYQNSCFFFRSVFVAYAYQNIVLSKFFNTIKYAKRRIIFLLVSKTLFQFSIHFRLFRYYFLLFYILVCLFFLLLYLKICSKLMLYITRYDLQIVLHYFTFVVVVLAGASISKRGY